MWKRRVRQKVNTFSWKNLRQLIIYKSTDSKLNLLLDHRKMAAFFTVWLVYYEISVI